MIARRAQIGLLPLQVNGWGVSEIRLMLPGKNFPAKITARITHNDSGMFQFPPKGTLVEIAFTGGRPDNLRIVDDGRREARIFLAGNIAPIQINNIAEKLALAGVQDAKLYKGIPDHEPEDWREYLSRLREQAEVSVLEESLRHSLPL